LISYGYSSEKEIMGMYIHNVLARLKWFNNREQELNKQQPACPLMTNTKNKKRPLRKRRP